MDSKTRRITATVFLILCAGLLWMLTPHLSPAAQANPAPTPSPLSATGSEDKATSTPPATPTPGPLRQSDLPLAAANSPALACTAGDLDAYLSSKGSPMTGTGASFVQRGSQSNVDPRFMIAIAGAETSFGKHLCSDYNAFNWFYSGWCTSPFSSWDNAIDVTTYGVGRYYLQAGQNTIYSFTFDCGSHCYCPNCTNWYNNVRTFYAEQGGNPDTNNRHGSFSTNSALQIFGAPTVGLKE